MRNNKLREFWSSELSINFAFAKFLVLFESKFVFTFQIKVQRIFLG